MRFDTALATIALAGAGVSAAPIDRRTAEALSAIVRSPDLDGLGPVLPWFPGKVYNSPGPNGEKRDAVQLLAGPFRASELIPFPEYGPSTGSQPPSLQKRQVDLEDLEAWAKSDPLSRLGPGQLSEQKRHVGSQDWSDFITIGGLRPITRPDWTNSNSPPAEQKRAAYPQDWLGRPRVPAPKSGGRLAVCGLYIGEC
ncbi:hypothetical protein CKM354_001195900 [Cercospora kikuchii]|uniref:Uncharacterized protein n=1 Tax=Cercospora kikuchii TaxID=84275 RepID=A0A9P3FIT5_9PEZI|nr:uncharacterized protein CKM354_001195900 [Cercospora kikuchii]GIZ48916.1 hypothetical protein CKM354_001195900 [Cercospora kikuchii]